MITGVAGFTAFLMMGMDGQLPTKGICGHALEDGYQKWYKHDPRRDS